MAGSSEGVEFGQDMPGSNYLDGPPPELLVKPQPCIVLTGLDVVHDKTQKTISDILTNDRKSDRAPINYIHRPVGHEYPKAKAKKTSYEWYVPRGILKTHWLRKHLTEVPAVVVIFYNLDWVTDPQWREKQGECQNLVRSVQNSLAGRSTKIVLVVIQEGTSLPPGGDAISEERCASLCAACGLQLQTSLFILQNNEQLHGCCIKLESRLYELAQNHYVMETRKVKEHRDALNKTTHQLLFVRHHFKTGFFSEFVRPPDGIQAALRNYRQAFGHLMDVRATDYNLHEIEIIAGFISYKIWSLSMEPGSSATQRDAEMHFRKHVDWLRSRIGQPELAFEHYAWLASQYRIFADLFADAIRSGGFTASISQHPGVYYHQAAVLTRERRQAILSAQTPQLPKPGTILANGTVILEGQVPHPSLVAQSIDAGALEFFGQRAWRPGYQSLEPPDAVTEAVGIAGLQIAERTTVDHSAIVTSLLSAASLHFRKLGSSRMCTRLSWETASELIHTFGKHPENAAIALSLLRTVVTEYRRDQWQDLLQSALLRQLQCPRVNDSEGFDADSRQELAAICFELAALEGGLQKCALDAFVAFVTGSPLGTEIASGIASSIVEAWNNLPELGKSSEATVSIDVSVLSNMNGLIQCWTHFPILATTLDKIPKIQMHICRGADTSNAATPSQFVIASGGVHVHYYYYHKGSRSSSTTSPSLSRVTTKMMDIELHDLPDNVKNCLVQQPFRPEKYQFDVNAEEASRVTAAAIKAAGDLTQDTPPEAFIAISGWWLDVVVDNGVKSGTLRLNWAVAEEPSPLVNMAPGSAVQLSPSSPSSPYPLTSRDLYKLHQRNQPPKWLSSNISTSCSGLLGSNLSASPYLCRLKPRKASVHLVIGQTASPALVGEIYPVDVTVTNTSSEIDTSDMLLDVSSKSTSCLLEKASNQCKPTNVLTVQIASIAAGSQRQVRAFYVSHPVPDVLKINVQLRYNAGNGSEDDAIVDVVRDSFSLPVIVPLTLVSCSLLDHETLVSLRAYCPQKPTVLSVKVSSSSTHDLELVSMKLHSPFQKGEISCAAVSQDDSWPRHLRPGTSFVEAFRLLAATLPESRNASVHLGHLTLQWRRVTIAAEKSDGNIPLVVSTISLPEFAIESPSVIIRTGRIPSRAVLYKPCAINYSVKNVSSLTLNIRATVQSPPGINSTAPMLISGPSDIGTTLMPGHAMSLPVSFIPLLSGFVALPRVRISAAKPAPPSSNPDPFGNTAAQTNVDVTDVSSSHASIFVQTAPDIEWLIPGTVPATS